MKARKRQHVTAALAALALVAAYAVTATGAQAQNCGEAWAASPAYGECGSRTDAPGSRHETVETTASSGGGTVCVIRTGCVYWVQGADGRGGSTKYTKKRRSNEWRGSLNDTRHVQNCSGGYLKRWC